MNNEIEYSVDQIEDDVIVLQDIKTSKNKIIYKKNINFKIKETDIILYDGVKFYKSEKKTTDRIKYLREKMNKLKIENK